MLTQAQFNEARHNAGAHDPLIKRVRLNQIELDDKSIENGSIGLGGHKVPVGKKFFNSLASAVNLNQTIVTKMGKNDDKDVQIKLLKALKGYSETREGGKEFLLIGDAGQGELSRIAKADNYHRLSNETMFATAETIMNEVPDMHIESIDTGSNGKLSLNLIHGSQVGYERIGADEVFRFGISLVNTDYTSRVDDFFYRLSCANGAVARNLTTAFEFGQGEDAFRKLLTEMQGWSKNGFVPVTFAARLEAANDVQASYAEVERALWAVTGSIAEKDPDQKGHIIRAIEQQFFPTYDKTTKRIFRAGYNPLQLTDSQKKFIKTDMTIWDVVNELTWIGSHEQIWDLKNSKQFKVEGGSLFSKNWDLQHAGLASI